MEIRNRISFRVALFTVVGFCEGLFWAELAPREFGQRRTMVSFLHSVNVFVSANCVLRTPMRPSWLPCTLRSGTTDSCHRGTGRVTRRDEQSHQAAVRGTLNLWRHTHSLVVQTEDREPEIHVDSRLCGLGRLLNLSETFSSYIR